MSIFSAFSGVFSIIIMGAIGYFSFKKKLIDPHSETFISKFALNITIPVLMFTNGYQYLTLPFIKSSSKYTLVAFATILFCFGLGYLLAILFRVKENQRGLCSMMFSLSNCIFIGLPVSTYYFGQEGVPSVMMYYIANTIIFWSIGNALIAKDGGAQFKMGIGILKNLFSPQVVSFFLGGAVGMIGIKIPVFLNTVLGSIGSMTTPLVTILAGAVIARIGITSALKLNRTSTIALVGRFIVSPLVVISTVILLGVPHLTANVFVAQSAMPVMNQTMLIAKYYKASDDVATKTLVASILIMMLALPITVLISSKLIPLL